MTAVVVLAGWIGAWSLPAPKTLPDSSDWGRGAQRFMKKLAAGQASKLVIMGQSISTSNNQWTHTVGDDLKARYPKATYDYAAVAACASDCLAGQVPGFATLSDAGCVLVYVYGGERGYEQLVRALKNKLPADCDIVFMGNHSVAGAYDSAYMPLYFLPDMCNRYNFGWIDIATPWARYLSDNNLSGQALRSDNVHLNNDGQTLMGQLVKPYFIVRNVTTTPRINDAWAVSGEKVFVKFSARLDSTSAQATANYALSGATVTRAQILGDQKTVALSTSPIAPGSYTLTVNGVKDREETPNVTSGATKTFTVTAPPAEWMEADIGETDGVKGSVTHTAGSTDFVVKSTGGDNTYFHKNELHYVYRQAFGDCEMVAKVTAITKQATDCRAMVMIRDDTTCYARFASMSTCLRQTAPDQDWQNAGVEFMTRRAWYDSLTVKRVLSKSLPRWIKVTRVGDVFTGYESADGTSWNPVGSPVTISMSHEVTIGLAAASQGTYGMTGTATFSNVAFKSSPSGVGIRKPDAAICPARIPDLTIENGAIVLNGLSSMVKQVKVSSVDGRLLYRNGIAAGRLVIRPAVRGLCVVTIVTEGRVMTQRVVLK